MNKEYTIRDLYEIYCEAMPRYPLAYERFRDILHKDNSQIFTAESSKTIIGFVVVNGNSVVILCVKKEYRHSGYGKHLLIMAEGFISANYDEVILGGSACYRVCRVTMTKRAVFRSLKKEATVQTLYRSIWGLSLMIKLLKS